MKIEPDMWCICSAPETLKKGMLAPVDGEIKVVKTVKYIGLFRFKVGRIPYHILNAWWIKDDGKDSFVEEQHLTPIDPDADLSCFDQETEKPKEEAHSDC